VNEEVRGSGPTRENVLTAYCVSNGNMILQLFFNRDRPQTVPRRHCELQLSCIPIVSYRLIDASPGALIARRIPHDPKFPSYMYSNQRQKINRREESDSLQSIPAHTHPYPYPTSSTSSNSRQTAIAKSGPSRGHIPPKTDICPPTLRSRPSSARPSCS
jgi:hypothetical protein